MPPRQSARDKFIEQLGKEWGSRVAPSRDEPAAYQVISTGILCLDRALVWGGWIEGRVHELVGQPDSAKTTLMTNSMREAQRKYPDKAVGYVDMEGTFDDRWAAANGLDLGRERWDHVYANDSEDAADLARKFARSGLHSMVVVDSIGGMESRKALEKDAIDPLPGKNAQIVTRMCKHLATLSRQFGTTVILVNQLRAQIGTTGGADVSAGPKALQHATTTKVQMSRGSEKPMTLVLCEGEDPEPVKLHFKARVTRSKAFPPGRIAEFWVNNRSTDEYGPAGIDVFDDHLTLGVRYGAIRQDGAWYTIGELPKVQGRLAAARLLREHPDTYAMIREQVLAAS